MKFLHRHLYLPGLLSPYWYWFLIFVVKNKINEYLNTHLYKRFFNNLQFPRFCQYHILFKFNNIPKIGKAKNSISFITKEPYEYRGYRQIYRRDIPPHTIIKTVPNVLNVQVSYSVKLKYNHSTSDIKDVSVFLMRCISSSSYKDICKTLGDITLSQTAKLNNKGFNLIQE